jgi:hypothetical protein
MKMCAIEECAERKRSKNHLALLSLMRKSTPRKTFFLSEQYMNKLRKLLFFTFIENGSSPPSPQVERGQAFSCHTQEREVAIMTVKLSGGGEGEPISTTAK